MLDVRCSMFDVMFPSSIFSISLFYKRKKWKFLYYQDDIRGGKKMSPLVLNPSPKIQKTILVVDDEEYVRAAMKDILIVSDYEVATASNGREALDILLEKESSPNRVSLIITDLSMPVMGGIRLIEEAGKLERKVPVLVISGKIDKEITARLLQNGVVEILHKPFLPKELLVIIKGIFNGGK